MVFRVIPSERQPSRCVTKTKPKTTNNADGGGRRRRFASSVGFGIRSGGDNCQQRGQGEELPSPLRVCLQFWQHVPGDGC